MRLEFKEAMDTYEAFYDAYCDFMIRYQKNYPEVRSRVMQKLVDVAS